ncbi:hypothetical protein A3F29_00935 [Candidatus Roizmanbacteria bacterium RIFCSPHIGHO2_12_FULL_33_9]|uniref:Replication-associated protein G2P N-terminal domain-containing protein n=1 Tax=Candidatus Roizmanbacteria bacterium RIFCSPHIGHO2_12_FULL_33_9 TaxID=1802045 RepID=A0A1F7HGI4_9BACT|nr:MAG: hypothetical protein A3F29_00935 [Candidatus Roizmanbacteria bacterium RIFCSPHIGHO2_12_FULL_33_9]
MIDTIKLVLDKSMFLVSDVSLFQKETYNQTRGYFKLVQNPSKGGLKSGKYKPRLTLTKRFNCSGRFEPTLSIELSLPKLMYGNNFVELTNTDFEKVIEKLSAILKEMGIRIFTHKLIEAPVSSIHYSKNIIFNNGLTPYILINKIRESNIRLSSDVDHAQFRNDGYSYKWHSNTYEVTFYDKLYDLMKSKVSSKRAIENDNDIQLNLFDKIKRAEKFEVLRMEVRLNNRQKTRSLFKTLGYNTNLTFKELFSSDYSKKVLLHYIKELEFNRPSILNYSSTNPKSLLSDLIINNPRLKPQKILQLFGLRQALEHYTERELRGVFNPKSYRVWYRIMQDSRRINAPDQQSPLQVIKERITEFKSISTVDFDKLMLNNDKYD